MPIGGKDAFLSKVTFRRESKWYSKTKQELKDMETIEERARLAAWQIFEEIGLSKHSVDRVAEIIEEKINEQKNIDDAKLLKLKSAWEKQAQINHDDKANYQQGYHDAIEKACEWIKENFEYYVDVEVSSYYTYGDKFVEDFRKAMEESVWK